MIQKQYIPADIQSDLNYMSYIKDYVANSHEFVTEKDK